MRKKYVVLLLIIVSFLLAIIFYFSPNEKVMKAQKNEVMSYLIQEKNYLKSDIKSIRTLHNIKGIGNPSEYEVEVIFTDEPKIKYYYAEHKGNVSQIEYSGHADKHIEY